MRRVFRIVFCVLVIAVLAGCDQIEDWIEGYTEYTVAVSRTISDSTKERDVQGVVVAEDILVNSGNYRAAGPVSVEPLAEPIAVGQIGLGEVRYFMRGRFHNQSSQLARIHLYLVPNAGSGEDPVEIGSVTVNPHTEFTLNGPAGMDQDPETTHERLAGVFWMLDEQYLVNPVIFVQGANSAGVVVDRLELAASPMYWKTEEFDTASIQEYKDTVQRVKSATLEGTVRNYGDSPAKVVIYLTKGDEFDPDKDRIATAIIPGGVEVEGYQMLLEGAEERIRVAFEEMIDGANYGYDYVVLSERPLKVKGVNLRLQAKLAVVVDIL
jgi:hypothetical protein